MPFHNKVIMSEAFVNEGIEKFKSFIDLLIDKHKPIDKESYSDGLIDCLDEAADKAKFNLNEFKEEKEGEHQLLKEAFIKEITTIKGKFESKYKR